MMRWGRTLGGALGILMALAPGRAPAQGPGGGFHSGTGMKVPSTDDPDTPEVESDPDWDFDLVLVFWGGRPQVINLEDGRVKLIYPYGRWERYDDAGNKVYSAPTKVTITYGPRVDGRDVEFGEYQMTQGPTGAATLKAGSQFVASGARL